MALIYKLIKNKEIGGKIMKIIMLGAPGAGKGTQAKKIAEKYSIPHISTGDIFRANIKNGTELGKKAKTYMDQGLLVPDELVVDLVVDRVQQDDCTNGYVLDGFPRTIAQAEALSGIDDIDYVINFVLDEEEIVKRLSGRRLCKSTGRIYHIVTNPPKKEGIDDETGEPLIQRDDDKPEAIRHRLEVYKASTEPLIGYYKEKGLLVDIDASVSPEDVLKSILSAVGR